MKKNIKKVNFKHENDSQSSSEEEESLMENFIFCAV